MKMFRNGILLFFFLMQSYVANAQLFFIKVVEQDSKGPIPFVTGKWNRTSKVIFSDVDGIFKLKEEDINVNDTLFLTHIGFESNAVAGFGKNLKSEQIILMKALVFELGGATIFDNSPITLLKLVKAQLKKSIPKNAIVQPSFYRQYHIEDGKGVFFLESLMSVCLGIGENKKVEARVDHLRRIPNTERNNEQHSDHLMDLLYANPIFNRTHGPLYAKILKNFKWSFGELPKDSSAFTKLNFVEQLDDNINRITGTLIIRNLDNALFKYSTSFIRMGDYDLHKMGGSKNFIWIKMEEICNFEFNWISDSVYLKSAHLNYTHLLVNSVFHSVDHELVEDFYWRAIDLPSESSDTISSYKSSSNLYSRQFKNEVEFWKNANIEQQFPVDINVLNLFGGILKLHDGFKAEGR